MTVRERIRSEVVAVVDILSPLDLARLSASDVEQVRIDFATGFDGSLKKALSIPLSKIALKHGASRCRLISRTETARLTTVRDAVELTIAAADGVPFGDEASRTASARTNRIPPAVS